MIRKCGLNNQLGCATSNAIPCSSTSGTVLQATIKIGTSLVHLRIVLVIKPLVL